MVEFCVTIVRLLKIWGLNMQKTGPGHVRIIAGSHRGSKLPIADVAGLRPTGDRVRETLFNWLQQKIAGRRVLDAFAGSGALGFEAASRGAASVVLLESSREAARSLRETEARLAFDNVQIIETDALTWMKLPSMARFDLVFLDPPFTGADWTAIWPRVTPLLAENAYVYVEQPLFAEAMLPEGIVVLKSGKTQHTAYLLAQWQKPHID